MGPTQVGPTQVGPTQVRQTQVGQCKGGTRRRWAKVGQGTSGAGNWKEGYSGEGHRLGQGNGETLYKYNRALVGQENGGK
jgi:hypothetical protein